MKPANSIDLTALTTLFKAGPVFSIGFASFNTTGHSNTAVGHDALYDNSTGTQNVAVGMDSAENITSGSENKAVGVTALQGVTSGTKNTAIGRDSGKTVQTGSANTAVGYNVGFSATNATNQIGIGCGITVSANDQFRFGQGGTDVVFNQFATNASFTRVSDQRTKKEINTNEDCGLDFINDLRTVTYKKRSPSELPETFEDYNPNITEPKHREKLYGMIAQEVKAALDKNNITDFGGWSEDENNGLQAISQEMFIYPLIKAVQELSEENKDLKSRIETLESS